MPKDDVFVRSKFTTAEEVEQCAKRPTRIDGIEQDPFSLRHKPNGLALEITDDAISRTGVVGIKDNVGGGVPVAQIEALCELIRKTCNLRLKRVFSRFILIDSDSQ